MFGKFAVESISSMGIYIAYFGTLFRLNFSRVLIFSGYNYDVATIWMGGGGGGLNGGFF